MAFHGSWAENAGAGHLAEALESDAVMAPMASHLLRERAGGLFAAMLRRVALVILLVTLFAVGIAIFYAIDGFSFGAALFGAIGVALAVIAWRFATPSSGR